MKPLFRLFAAGLLVLGTCALPSPSIAQTTSALVTATCGNQSLTAGTNRAVSQDTTGKECVNATVSATATVAVAPLSSTNAAGSIVVTDTFQSIHAADGTRQGCLVQNQSTTDTMWVYFGAIGGATKAKSFILDSTHGLQVSCAVGGLGVLTDQVSITGTATDLYNANFQ